MSRVARGWQCIMEAGGRIYCACVCVKGESCIERSKAVKSAGPVTQAI